MQKLPGWEWTMTRMSRTCILSTINQPVRDVPAIVHIHIGISRIGMRGARDQTETRMRFLYMTQPASVTRLILVALLIAHACARSSSHIDSPENRHVPVPWLQCKYITRLPDWDTYSLQSRIRRPDRWACLHQWAELRHRSHLPANHFEP